MFEVCTNRRRFRRLLSILLAAAASGCLVSRAGAAYLPGIDVSNYQASMNWTAVKNAGVKYAFVKATEGVDYVDPSFANHMANAKSRGILVGTYHFCRPESRNGVAFTSYNGLPFVPGSSPYEDAVSEAQDYIDAIRPYYQTGQYLPPVADVERFPNFGSSSLERTFVSYWVQLFSDTIYNALGVRPLVYTNLSNANSRYTSAVSSSHNLWLAWYRSTGSSVPPVPSDTPNWEPWTFWQWSQSWTIPGYSGPLDADLFNGTMEDLEDMLLGFDGLAGDFNDDNVVDAADYVMWRKTMGQTVPMFTGADGNGNARIDAGDLAAWKMNFGRVGAGSGGGGAVPEPVALGMIAVATLVSTALLRRKRCG